MEDDLYYMQQQAARRVQEMQAHSRRVVAGEELPAHAHGWPGDTPGRIQSPGLYIRPEQPPAPPPPEPKPEPEPKADVEQWFLLGLAMLLHGGSPQLSLALLYLAM